MRIGLVLTAALQLLLLLLLRLPGVMWQSGLS
jgi:hypothetical protein